MSDTALLWVTGAVDIIIPAIIFIFLNNSIFFSAETEMETPLTRKEHTKKILHLSLLSPMGLVIFLFFVLFLVETVLGGFLYALGFVDSSLDFMLTPDISPDGGFTLDPAGVGSNEILLVILVLAFIVAIPLVMLVIRRYCKVVGCQVGVGVFIYMAVMYMFVVASIISFPIRKVNPSASSVASSVTFIVTLLIFYLPSVDKIALLLKQEDSKLLRQMNALPIINFVLMLILLGLEFMLDSNGYLNPIFYAIIFAFSIILYASAQLSYNVLFQHIEEREKIRTLSHEVIQAEEEVILAFAEITEAKSGQTGKHVKRVSEYSRVLATAMGFPDDKVEEIRLASMMHDIGKLLIPPEILEKMGRLTDEEFAVIKTHVTIGESLLHNAPGEIMEYARAIALQHHEWWDGNGYLGAKGEEIDISARITAVADVFDAVTSNRSYKKAWSNEEAYNMIVEESGTHFDPDVVAAFTEHFDEIKRLREIYDDNATYAF